MNCTRMLVRIATTLLLAFATMTTWGQGAPAPKEGTWIAKDFRFHSGEVFPELRLHYTTVGAPAGEPVLVLHGTTGSGAGLLNPGFGGELFAPGQPLDAAKYFIILPDAIGHGKSSKPSDGLRAKFPRYNYTDMVDAQYRLLKEHLGVKHLRLVIGNSMGSMETWIWGARYPDYMDTLVPMASLPSEMSSRNWILRRLITDSIRNDPEWDDGNYTKQPRSAHFASVFYSCALGVAKPDIAFFERVLQALDLRGNNVLFLDDRQENVEAARRASLAAAVYSGESGAAILHGVLSENGLRVS